ncbi:MAG: 50S ribosomal protein L30 [Acidimicrobiia bacterium]|nr:50S ribosomal protein L30 [Acidimicrobiia bacterium]MBP8181016.1 50S ribosomal protein L30 [Acidimicrobiia bacterium]
MADLTITLVRSTIGSKPKHRATIKAMGLRRINDSRTLPDSPAVRGMIQRVRHLVEVEEN